MSDTDKTDQELGRVGEIVEPPRSKRPPFSNLSRELSEKDLATPAARRFLLAELDRLHYEIDQLKKDLDSYRDKFFETDKERAVLSHVLSSSKTWEKLFDVCLGIGGVLIGLTQGLWNTPPYGYFLLLAGCMLVGSGAFLKYRLQ